MVKRPKGKIARGKRLTKGSGYWIEDTKGKPRRFMGRLLSTHNLGSKRIAIFSVPKKSKKGPL